MRKSTSNVIEKKTGADLEDLKHESTYAHAKKREEEKAAQCQPWPWPRRRRLGKGPNNSK
jgi:hypothetical protein